MSIYDLRAAKLWIVRRPSQSVKVRALQNGITYIHHLTPSSSRAPNHRRTVMRTKRMIMRQIITDKDSEMHARKT